MSKKVIDILCATDENYVSYCGIMLTSLLENNKDVHVNIYILAAGLSEASETRLNSLAAHYDCTVNIIGPDIALFKDCPVREGDHVSQAAYYRIMCGRLLPEHVTKVLYLDCDIIVNTGIADLYSIDLSGSLMAACVDSYSTSHRHRLGLSQPYFNSGVMVIDVARFRSEDIATKCFNAIRHDPDRFMYHDQDALNIVAGENITYLNPRWNMLSAFLRRDKVELEMSRSLQDEIIQTLKEYGDRLVIHYEYLPKPWQKWVIMPHPFRKQWLGFRKISLWPDARIDRRASLKFKLQVIALRTLWKLGLKKKPDYYLA